jgi:hypothetical protein
MKIQTPKSKTPTESPPVIPPGGTEGGSYVGIWDFGFGMTP